MGGHREGVSQAVKEFTQGKEKIKNEGKFNRFAATGNSGPHRREMPVSMPVSVQCLLTGERAVNAEGQGRDF